MSAWFNSVYQYHATWKPLRNIRFTTMMATGQIVSISLLGISTMLLLTPIGAAEKPAGLSQPSLVVTPATSIVFSGPKGGPFLPSFIGYRVRASTGTVSYSIRAPSWLTAE
jgi:hypothetical protein